MKNARYKSGTEIKDMDYINLLNPLTGYTVNDLRLIRGLGIIPARFEVEVSRGDDVYILNAEVDFRVLYRGEIILCFEDLFLDKNLNEITTRKYRAQKDIEFTLAADNIARTLKHIRGRKIKSIRVAKCGDVELCVGACRIQFLNDTHYRDLAILGIVSPKIMTQFTYANGEPYSLPTELLEVENSGDGGIVASGAWIENPDAYRE